MGPASNGQLTPKLVMEPNEHSVAQNAPATTYHPCLPSLAERTSPSIELPSHGRSGKICACEMFASLRSAIISIQYKWNKSESTRSWKAYLEAVVRQVNRHSVACPHLTHAFRWPTWIALTSDRLPKRSMVHPRIGHRSVTDRSPRVRIVEPD
jgi:hypothetical protein